VGGLSLLALPSKSRLPKHSEFFNKTIKDCSVPVMTLENDNTIKKEPNHYVGHQVTTKFVMHQADKENKTFP
jgi:hypothetical protein